MNEGSYSGYLKPRSDAADYELIAFESADYKFLSDVRQRFQGHRFTLVECLVWIEDGMAEFRTDGESDTCSLVGASGASLEFPVKSLPCLDLSRFLRDNYCPADYLVMKLDIEGAEFAVLDKLIADGTISLLRELYVEYHQTENEDWEGRQTEIDLKLRSIPGLYYRNDWP